MSIRVLCLLAPGFEEIETVTPIDLLRRAGAEVTVASITDERLVKGRSQIALQADTTLGETQGEAYHLLLIPGGPGVMPLRADGRPAALAKSYVEHGKPVAAICAAPLVLKDAGLLDTRRHTAHQSVAAELPNAELNERVIEDGLIITSRGAGTAIDFGLAVVRRLFGDEKAAEIATSIMA